MNLTLITGIVALVLGSAVAWGVQGDRIDKIKAEHEQQLATLKLDAANLAAQQQQAVTVAVNAAVARRTDLERNLAAVRTERDGLRDSIAIAMRAATASHDACLERAGTAGKLLDQCAEALERVAKSADGHRSDVRTLRDGWPR